MAKIGPRDQPTYYNIIGKTTGAIIATASASKVLRLRKELQKQYNGEELEIVLIEVGA